MEAPSAQAIVKYVKRTYPHNYDEVMTALEIITDRRGINLGPSKITISTVGVIPGIARLAAEKQPYHLAVSLHGAPEAERAELVPVSRRWPLEPTSRASQALLPGSRRGSALPLARDHRHDQSRCARLVDR